MTENIENLTRAVEAMHGVKATHQGVFFVHEAMDGATVRQGRVDMFALEGHPKATRAFAWAWDDNGEVRYTAFLNVPPINTPRDAVRAAIASGQMA